MRCSCVETDFVLYPSFPGSIATGDAVQDPESPVLTYPSEIKHCVLDSPFLLFGSFPCKVATQYRFVLPRLVTRDATPQVAIIDLAAVLPDGSDARELHPFARLA